MATESKKEKFVKADADQVRASIGAATTATPIEIPKAAGPSTEKEGLKRITNASLIPLARIKPDPGQPRKFFEEESIDQLAASLKLDGQQQPIRVRYDQVENSYVIIMGERRYRAAIKAGLPALACIIEDGPLDQKRIRKLQLIENLQREDLNDIDKAAGFRDLMVQNGWTQRELASELSMSQPTVARILLLNSIAPEVQEQVRAGEITAASAVAISQLDTPEEQIEVAQQIQAGGMNKNEAAQLVKSRKAAKPKAGKARGKAQAKAKKVEKEKEIYKSISGYQIHVTKRSGIDRAELAGIVAAWSEELLPVEATALETS